MNPPNSDRIPLTAPLFAEGPEMPARKRHILPFSLYQAGLFIVDIVIGCVCFYVSLYLFSLDHAVLARPAEMAVSFFGASMMIAFFPTYRLYSYHLTFDTKNHMKNLVKAFCWSILMFAVVGFLYAWPTLFAEHALITGAVIFISASGLALLARFLWNHIGNFVKAVGISFIAVGLTGLLLGNERPVLVENPAAAFLAMMLFIFFISLLRYFLVRVVCNVWLRKYFRRQVMVIGSNEEAEEIVRHIIRLNAPFWVAGLINVNGISARELEKRFASKQCLGDLCDLPKIIKEKHLDEVIVTDETIDRRILISLLDYCVSIGVIVWFPPRLMPIIEMKLYIDNFCGLSMIRMCLQRNSLLYPMIKRVLDVLLTVPALLLLSPLFLAIALAIKLDSKGPVLYKATAVGENGKTFQMLKFRSMRPNESLEIHRAFVTKFIKGEIRRDQKKNVVLKIVDDLRVTRVGKILRKFSLDELPQLVNVFKGDMGLIGPRPCLPYEYAMYKDWHKKRNSVLPGITGLWQIAGRSEVSFEEMILLDLYYIYNRNVMMDMIILFETIFAVLGERGAY